jgi:hypothetical protein
VSQASFQWQSSLASLCRDARDSARSRVERERDREREKERERMLV